MRRALLILFLLGLFPSAMLAHEVRPAYLELRQIDAETFDVLWKVPARGENLRLGLYVEFPADSIQVQERTSSIVNDAFTERWTIKRSGGLVVRPFTSPVLTPQQLMSWYVWPEWMVQLK